MEKEPPFEGRRRFRPQDWVWLLPPAAIGLVLLYQGDLYFQLLFGLPLLVGFFGMSTTFLVGPEGVETRGLFRRRSHRWEEMGGLAGRRVEDLSRHDFWTGSTATFVSNTVRGPDGRVLFRFGPWTRRRRKLARLIRRGIRARVGDTETRKTLSDRQGRSGG